MKPHCISGQKSQKDAISFVNNVDTDSMNQNSISRRRSKKDAFWFYNNVNTDAMNTTSFFF